MSGKPKKNKAPAVKKPLDDEFPAEEIEEVPVEVEEIDAAPAKSDKGKEPADAKKKKKSKGFKLSSIDPIILASFSVFMIACLIVTGITVYGIVAGDTSNKTAEYGDSVELYYTGSYFAYYDEDGAVIFDTDMEEVGEDNEKYKKSYGYTVKESYSAVEMTVGQGEWLDDFKNALIGHKPGDVVKVKIVDGYGSLTDDVNKFTVVKAGQTISKFQEMTVSDYKTFFGVDDAPGAGVQTVDSPYGWKANVVSVSGDMVSVEYIPEDDGTYTKNEVTYKVNGAVTDEINFDYQIENFEYNTKILKGAYDGQIVYFIGSDGANMTYKTTKETVGTTMYFTIKFVGYVD